MSRADSQLDFGDLRPQENGSETGPPRAGIFLNGDVVCCACPDCGSPLTIRVWLMAADCWVCGAAVILTEEQQREVERLLQVVEARKSVEKQIPLEAPPPEAPVAPPPEPPKPAPVRKENPAAPAAPKPRPKPKPARPPALPPAVPAAPERTPAARAPSRIRRRLSEVSQEGEATVWFRDLFRNLPAWLISALIHMALLILLAMMMEGRDDEYERPLILSTRVGPEDRPGAEEEPPAPDPIEFEKKGDPEPKKDIKPEPPPKKEPTKPEPKKDPPPDPGKQPKPDPAPSDPRTGTLGKAGGSSLKGRSPTARARLAEQEGGTTASEAAVAKGLEWIARHQNSDGSWSLHAFNKAGECRGRCTHTGEHSDTAGTALALLPFLGAGETHVAGKYKEEVRKGLYWLVQHQGRDGDLRGAGSGNMYAHGQAAIALCEAFALTQDEELRAAGQLALDFIVRAQHPAGGWRYQPGQPGDVSVVGWQVMALRSGQMAYLKVPKQVLEKAGDFLDSCRTDRYGGKYTYMPVAQIGVADASREALTLPAMTAEGLLCRQYSGWPANHQGLTTGVRWMLDKHPPSVRESNMYYWYYATQVVHHQGGAAWKEWNAQMRDLLVKTQERTGHQAGSWTPKPAPGRVYDMRGGRLYMTALAVCTLEVYYRHLPLYRSVAVEE
jgi:type IV secretory pathway VirB10-like protein